MKTRKAANGLKGPLSQLNWPSLSQKELSSPTVEVHNDGEEATFGDHHSRAPLATRPQYWSTSILNKYKLNAW